MEHTISFPFNAGQTGIIGCVNASALLTLTGLSSPGATNASLAYLVTQRPGHCDTTNGAEVPEQPAGFGAYVGNVDAPASVFPGGIYGNWNVVGDVPLGYRRAVDAGNCLVVAVENAPEAGVVRLHFEV
jgi:hypothetical protein